MKGGLKPYPKYRNSGVPWLGQIPEHWAANANRVLFEERKEVTNKPTQMLSVTMSRGVIRQSDLIKNTSKKDSSNEDKTRYKVVHPGDIAYNKMRMWQGAVGASQFRGIVSPAYIVARPRKNLDPAYCHYLLRIPAYVKECHRYSYGICDDQLSLRFEDFKRIVTPIPSIDEQRFMVRYLDHKTALIDRYIRQKKRMIALLEERKRIIIDEAVMGKIDVRTGRPYPKYKDSGVEWLGMVPEGWEAVKIKRLAKSGTNSFTDGDWIETPYISAEGIRLIQTGNIGIGEYREKGFRYISQDTFLQLKCTEVYPNDVLICRLDGPVGRGCLAPNLVDRMITSVDNTILRTRSDIDPQFIVRCISSKTWLDWVQSLCRAGGGFRYRVSRSMLGILQLPIPPKRKQKEIIDYLDASLASIIKAIQGIEMQIARQTEYRTRLISDVVTGKLDVRAAAVRLPEVADPEPGVDDDDQGEELAEDEANDEEAEE